MSSGFNTCYNGHNRGEYKGGIDTMIYDKMRGGHQMICSYCGKRLQSPVSFMHKKCRVALSTPPEILLEGSADIFEY